MLIDPDTGIADRATPGHISVDRIVSRLKQHDVVIVHDQSFDRNAGSPKEQMRMKLKEAQSLGAFGFYYDSHARFLFVARDHGQMQAMRDDLRGCGIPLGRFIEIPGSVRSPEPAP